MNGPFTDAVLVRKASYFFRQPEAWPAMHALLERDREGAQANINSELDMLVIGLCDIRDDPRHNRTTQFFAARELADLTTAWDYLRHVQCVGEPYGACATTLQQPPVFIRPDEARGRALQIMQATMSEMGLRFGGYDIGKEPEHDVEVLHRIRFGFDHSYERHLWQVDVVPDLVRELLWRAPDTAGFYLRMDHAAVTGFLCSNNHGDRKKAEVYLKYLEEHFYDPITEGLVWNVF